MKFVPITQHMYYKANILLYSVFCLITFSLIGCPAPDQPVNEKPYTVPQGFPEPIFPADNLPNAEKIELGRKLFYDPILSSDKSVACASCHKQELAFTDGNQVSRGVNRELGNRNSPTIVNTAYNQSLFWDGRSATIEEQALAAATNPAEMRAVEPVIDVRLQQDSAYTIEFARAFGNGTKPTTRFAMKAIATFVRTVLSGSSRYDEYNNGNKSALNESEIRGKDLFFSSVTQCSECHKGYNFTDNQFHSTGLFSHYYDEGRSDITKSPSDVGSFKTPSLRNIALTAPYEHDGHLPTLEAVIEHYNSGGKNFLNKDSRIRPLNLTDAEKQDLVAFLRSLTDNALLQNPKFAK
ncbi:MAG: c-type cytochrome [Ignavibacteriae bacterium]|nr:c-type cytochrome [Ignavibacteriota bacterium]